MSSALRMPTLADVSFRIRAVSYSFEEFLDRFGIVPYFDDLGLFDFFEM
jgi:hypothetical protein